MRSAGKQPLSDALVAEIAAALEATWELAPFSVGGAAVYRLRFTPPGRAVIQLTLWPTLARADVLAGDYYAIFKRIDNVLLFPGQEVIFQRGERDGFLLVSREGRVATVG